MLLAQIYSCLKCQKLAKKTLLAYVSCIFKAPFASNTFKLLQPWIKNTNQSIWMITEII